MPIMYDAVKDLIPNPKDLDLNTQTKVLLEILKLNNNVWTILDLAEKNLKMPWYLAGGGIYHSIWNYYSNQPIDENIKDYDIFYFSKDISNDEHQKLLSVFSSKVKKTVDLTNIYDIHLWFKDNFKREIPPYNSIEDDFNSFGNSVTAIGITQNEGIPRIYAPFGLHDIFSMKVRFFSGCFTTEEQINKANSWKNRWPNLQIL